MHYGNKPNTHTHPTSDSIKEVNTYNPVEPSNHKNFQETMLDEPKTITSDSQKKQERSKGTQAEKQKLFEYCEAPITEKYQNNKPSFQPKLCLGKVQIEESTNRNALCRWHLSFEAKGFNNYLPTQNFQIKCIDDKDPAPPKQ